MSLKKKSKSDSLIVIKVIPNASKNMLLQDESGNLKLRLTAPPLDGKANKECIAFFSKQLKIPKSHIVITKGDRSRHKIITFTNYRQNELEEKLQCLLQK